MPATLCGNARKYTIGTFQSIIGTGLLRSTLLAVHLVPDQSPRGFFAPSGCTTCRSVLWMSQTLCWTSCRWKECTWYALTQTTYSSEVAAININYSCLHTHDTHTHTPLSTHTCTCTLSPTHTILSTKHSHTCFVHTATQAI